MKYFGYRSYLKIEIFFLRNAARIFKAYQIFVSFFFYVKSFGISISHLYNRLSRSYKILFIALCTCIGVSSVFLLGNAAYSQTITPTSETALSSVTDATPSVLPANYVQSEYTQLMQLMHTIISGSTSSTGQRQSGLLGAISGTESYLFINNPVSITQYSRYYAQAHGFIRSADAQTTGTGFTALSPVIPLWEVFRNVAYLVLVIMVVIIGFVIIFGGKYGQSEVSLISSLPKIVIAVIVITFSYPIAGFVVDISNLGTNVIAGILGPRFVQAGAYFPGQYPVSCLLNNTTPISIATGATQNPGVDQCPYQEPTPPGNKQSTGDFNVFRMIAPIASYGQWGGGSTPQETIANLIDRPTNIGLLDAFLYGVNILQNQAEWAIDFIINVVVLFISLRVFVLILTSFIRIVIGAMLGPLMLIGYPLSGASSLMNWLRSLLSPAIVFPAVFAMLFVAAILAYGTQCGTSSCAQLDYVPGSNNQMSYNGGPWYISGTAGIQNFKNGPLLFIDTVNPQFIWNFVALGIVFAIPAIGKHIDDILKAQVSKYIESEVQRGIGDVGRYSRIPLNVARGAFTTLLSRIF